MAIAVYGPFRPFRRRSGNNGSSEDKSNEDDNGEKQNDDPSGDGEETGGGDPQKPITPVGFWDSRLAHVRKEAISKWALTTVILMTFILGVLAIYWAVLFHMPENLPSLGVLVVDFDGVAPFQATTPVVGPTMIRMIQQLQTMPDTLGWTILSPATFNNDPTMVRQAIYNEDGWAAIIINPNATAMLDSAVNTGNTSYDPLGALQLVYIDSRDDTTMYDFILPIIRQFQTQAVAMVGETWTRMTLQRAATDAAILTNLQNVPQALSPAVGFSEYNLRPLYPYTTIPATTIGLIYLIILSFFSFAFYLPIHVKYLKPEGHPPLKFYQLIIWRWCATITAYFFLSLAYSLVSLAFQINFSGGNPVSSQTMVTAIAYGNPDAYGRGTFPVYWMLNFVGMGALGLACENVAMVVGQPWTGMWLIFWVITNVSTSFYNITWAPGFYQWGYAWPLHNIVNGSRQILFDLHSNIGLNFGVLFAWCAINTALFPLACYYMRWKSKHHVHEYYA